MSICVWLSINFSDFLFPTHPSRCHIVCMRFTVGPPDRAYLGDLQYQNNEFSRELGNLKKELELTNQKLSSSMHSIKTFWSPELKKERALRKEESAKYNLINDQLKLLNNENQKQAMLVRQLEEELRIRMRQPSLEVHQQMETLYAENEHLTREIAILRDTIKVSWDEVQLHVFAEVVENNELVRLIIIFNRNLRFD